jgi:hypothetical protein
MIYLATPYWSDDPNLRPDRFILACRIAAKLMLEGHVVFSPIAHSHSVAVHGNLPPGHDFDWMAQDLPMLRNCQMLLVAMMPGWKESKGIALEIREAAREHIYTEYLDYETMRRSFHPPEN